jgi:hypothetical protein
MTDQLDTTTSNRPVRQKRDIPLVGNDDDVVLPFLDWCALAGLPESTAREMRARGQGPRVVHLTGKKLGVTMAEHRRWIKSRMED